VYIYDSWVTITYEDIYRNIVVNQLAGYETTYSIATLSYDNYYVNLRDYSNSLLSGLLQC
jgi:hypothetical protein